MDSGPGAAVGADAPVAGGSEYPFLQLVAVGRGDGKVDAHCRRAQAQAARYVVAVANVGQIQPVGMTVAFGHRQQVGHNLAGMLHIRQGVDDRHAAVLRQLHQRLVPIDPRHNAVHIAAEYPRHIGHRSRRPRPTSSGDR